MGARQPGSAPPSQGGRPTKSRGERQSHSARRTAVRSPLPLSVFPPRSVFPPPHRYDEDGKKARYFKDDDDVDLETLVRRTKWVGSWGEMDDSL